MSFTLHIQAEASVKELAKWLRATPGLDLKPMETRSGFKGSWIDFGGRGLHLRLFESDDHDPRLMDEEDGWLYYPYVLEATRTSPALSLEGLKDVANTLLDRVRDLGGVVEILSDWDDEGMDL